MKYIREVSVRYGKKQKALDLVRGPSDISKIIKKIIKENGKEHFMLFCLDGNHAVVAYNIVSIGTQNMAPVHPREVFQPALLAGAVSIIIAHNHPSGNIEPSREDFACTKKLMEAAELLQIKLLDHIIVGDNDNYYSMQEKGTLGTFGFIG